MRLKMTPLGVNGPYPAPGGACSGYLFESDGGTQIAVELGAGTLSRLLEITTLRRLDALVLTHLHFDHMSDALPLRYALDFEDRQNLLVVAPEEPKNVAALLRGGKMDWTGPEDMQIGDFFLSFILTTHPVQTYAIAFSADGKRAVYTGDTNENSALELFADGADVLVADAGCMERDYAPKGPHLSAKRCGMLAARASAKRLCLTHLSPRYDAEAVLLEAREAFPRAELLRPFETVYV
jgi:ribonuclease BN (tRNA processing enzyme)